MVAIDLEKESAWRITRDTSRPAAQPSSRPGLKPPTAHWFVLAGTASPSARQRDLSASVVAASDRTLRESMPRRCVAAEKVATPGRASVKAIAMLAAQEAIPTAR
jgi:hypothetical protein